MTIFKRTFTWKRPFVETRDQKPCNMNTTGAKMALTVFMLILST